MAIEQVPEGEELAHDRMVNLGAQWHRVGLERPHFCTRFRGQSDARGRSSPQRNFLQCFARVVAGFQTKQVKKVRNTLCTFKLATSSPEVRPTEFVLKDLRRLSLRKSPCKLGQIGRERPRFFAVGPPKKCCGVAPALVGASRANVLRG